MRRALPILLFLCALPCLAAAQDRVALLIGNGGYADDALGLRNPANDVRALDTALTELGFEVRAEVDLGRPAMREALDWLRRAAQEAEVALVFFAGHAVQVGSENLMIGVDLPELSAAAVAGSSVTLTEVLDAVESAGADLALVVLDACRDNPLGAAQVGRAGLSPVSGGLGTLVAYATDPGNVATDGFGDNSTFTEALLDHVATPGIDVRVMFGRVRQQVVRATGGQQVPWVEEAVLGEHYLAAAPPERTPDDEVRIWRAAVAAQTVEGYSDYLGRFPEGIYRIVAGLRIDELQGAALPAAHEVPLTAEQLADARAALEMIGYVVPGAVEVGPGRIRQAFALWRSVQPGGAGDFSTLMREAARTATFVGTYTAGILQTDLRRFASVDEGYRASAENLRIAEADFADDPAAQNALETMRADLGRIGQIRLEVAADLDQSRTYYGDLVTLTVRHLADWMTEAAQPRFASSRGITRLSDRALSDARMFHDHLRMARTAPDGSYAWLAAMLKEF
ncbi:hypothetical protein DKT77_00785 [Meridianimarinicoccus roseus]|uniref:Caspase family p20 domain-containing protein n=1 Tax=Meridianimarinicoccus roseus TaxID=2072018 RepID=A0A2V2LGC9_9RHOB|nr:caspase family protein [Meridianimarinicoccus roseus]PWR04535.1 hypothetical protein DKT77_00785 [Meridianimarinicoccus roseus]